METATIAIFASGAGTNAEKIIRYFKGHPSIRVGVICTNRPQAKVLELASKEGINHQVFTKSDFYEPGFVSKQLADLHVTHIVLAGFLWLIPADLVKTYSNKIINIHPALLPQYGGKGMYGMYVHQAVQAAGEKETGITIHLVNEVYDDGRVLLQQKVQLNGTETAEEIALKVQELEHRYFAPTIEKWILNNY